MRLISGLIIILLLGVILFLSIKLYQVSTTNPPDSQIKQIQVSGKVSIPPKLLSGKQDEAQSVDITFTIPEKNFYSGSTQSSLSQYLLALLTGLFTLFGTSVVLIYNYIANSSTRKFEWGKHLWDKYQDLYLDLRHTVNTTIDAQVIQNKLNTIRNRVFLPQLIENQILELISFLQEQKPATDKRKKTNDFLRTFEDFISRPWDYL